jgi:hypothetical protein
MSLTSSARKNVVSYLLDVDANADLIPTLWKVHDPSAFMEA